MREHVIEAKNVTKRYGNVQALKSVDITVKRGDIYGLVGDNGAGKTTFLKLLTGQIYSSEGEFRLFGEYAEAQLNKNRKRIGAIVETPGLYPRLSVQQNLEYYRIQRGIPGRHTVEETLKAVGMWDKRKRKGNQLSLGMKQRLGLAIALLGTPELLVLDEPINGLDPSGIIEIRNLLLKLNKEKNITIIISSHILSELEHIASVYGFLSQGWMMQQIEAQDLKQQCGGYLEIQVSKPEQFATILEKDYKECRYQVMPDFRIRILDTKIDAEKISTLAVKNGIGILRLEQKQTSLENYYVNLKERGRLSC